MRPSTICTLNDLKDAKEIRAEDLFDFVVVHAAIEERSMNAIDDPRIVAAKAQLARCTTRW